MRELRAYIQTYLYTKHIICIHVDNAEKEEWMIRRGPGSLNTKYALSKYVAILHTYNTTYYIWRRRQEIATISVKVFWGSAFSPYAACCCCIYFYSVSALEYYMYVRTTGSKLWLRMLRKRPLFSRAPVIIFFLPRKIALGSYLANITYLFMHFSS